MTISFQVDRTEFDLIDRIADRAQSVAKEYGAPFDRQGMVMDLTAVHANGCRLRLAELLEAKPFDFAHDVFGISLHLDRKTGQLGDFFLPRYAA